MQFSNSFEETVANHSFLRVWHNIGYFVNSVQLLVLFRQKLSFGWVGGHIFPYRQMNHVGYEDNNLQGGKVVNGMLCVFSDC